MPIMGLYDDSTKDRFKRERDERMEKLRAEMAERAAELEALRDKVASNPEFVAEELVRSLNWARVKAREIGVAFQRRREANCDHNPATYNPENEEYLERWLLRYKAIEVQALSGLAAIRPEVLARLAKK